MIFFSPSQETFLNSFIFPLPEKPKKFAILGDIRSGKTTQLVRCLKELEQKGLKVGGFFQPEENNTYYIEDIQTKERLWLAKRLSYDKNLDKAFLFNEKAFSFAKEIILKALSSCDVIVLDEIGRLEAQGNGHASLMELLLKQEEGKYYLFSIREDILKALPQELLKDLCCLKLQKK